ncbi:MAG: hypothetical protein ACO1SV_20410 [Fimbriimonas sp.]
MQEDGREPTYRQAWLRAAGSIVGGLLGFGLTVLVTGPRMNTTPDYAGLLFLGVPFLIGLAGTLIAGIGGKTRHSTGFWIGAGGLLAYALAMLMAGFEGLICLFMAAPVALLPMMFGVCIGIAVADAFYKVPLVLLTFGSLAAYDHFRPPEAVSEVATPVIVDASPDRVWREIVALGELPPPTDPILRTGIACPVKTEIRGTGVGAARHCTLTTGAMPERITAWEPGRRLTFVALETPAMMREVNPFRKTEPPHLKGHYRVLQGDFVLDALPDGRTRLWRTTRYAHRFGPAFYWTYWCDFAAERAHRYVLDVVKERSEQSPVARASRPWVSRASRSGLLDTKDVPSSFRR